MSCASGILEIQGPDRVGSVSGGEQPTFRLDLKYCPALGQIDLRINLASRPKCTARDKSKSDAGELDGLLMAGRLVAVSVVEEQPCPVCWRSTKPGRNYISCLNPDRPLDRCYGLPNELGPWALGPRLFRMLPRPGSGSRPGNWNPQQSLQPPPGPKIAARPRTN